ncbi:protein NO VEIN domain-containing protein [Curtobacterium sp. WHRI 8282]|uniref:protein NO VEIN domain-containing protein n=1 Tax=Curtobacterium sp. WHRI 8282 TaxID=3162559 RepID=UPI0032EC738C
MPEEKVLAPRQIDAMYWYAQLLGDRGVDVLGLHSRLRTISSTAGFRYPELLAAEEYLLDGNLLVEESGTVRRGVVLRRLLELDVAKAKQRLADILASVQVVSPSPLPDLERRARVGLEGELLVIGHLQDRLASVGAQELIPLISHDSKISDGFGWDVSFTALDGFPRQIEVKATERSGLGEADFRFHLTRHEYEVGSRNTRSWAICCVWVDSQSIAGWTRADLLEPFLPQGGSGYWTQARVDYPVALLWPGVPHFEP